MIKKLLLILYIFIQVFQINATNYYVDGNVSVSGNGLSWSTAWKTIADATAYNLLPGDVVWIKEGTYTENIHLKKSGSEIVPITSGIVINNNVVQFPLSTDFSSINLNSNPGQYYLYIYRSWKSNNGVYKIISIDSVQKTLIVQSPNFVDEVGVNGDFYRLSACIGRPIIFKNAALNPLNDRVLLDVSSTNINTVGYIGIPLPDPLYLDAQPVNFNIVDGIDLTGSKNGGGWHIQSSNFNVIMNSRIYNMGTQSLDNAPGIFINGNSLRPATYNMIINNHIFNTPYEGVYVGSGSNGQYYNNANFNHIIGNFIYTVGSTANAKLENAIEFKEYNYGNVAERNEIGPHTLSTAWNGSINIVEYAHHIIVYNNILKNISKGSGSSYYYIIGVNNNATENYVYNNLIYNETLLSGNLYAISIKSSGLTNSFIAHNTIYKIPCGLLLDNSQGNSTTIANNIVYCPTPITNWSNNNINITNNLYAVNPTSYGAEPGRLIGYPNFADTINFDFSLTPQSNLAIDNSVTLNPAITIDINRTQRDNYPDRGAFEFHNTTLIPNHETKNVNPFFFISPNPAKDYIDIKTEFDYFVVNIFDIYGKKVYTGNNDSKIELSFLDVGIYIIQIQTYKYTTHGKFMVTR